MDVLTVCRQKVWKDLYDIICSWSPFHKGSAKLIFLENIWNGFKEGEWNLFYYDDCLYTISSKLYLIFNEVKISAQNIEIFWSAIKACYVTVDPLKGKIRNLRNK